MKDMIRCYAVIYVYFMLKIWNGDEGKAFSLGHIVTFHLKSNSDSQIEYHRVLENRKVLEYLVVLEYLTVIVFLLPLLQ